MFVNWNKKYIKFLIFNNKEFVVFNNKIFIKVFQKKKTIYNDLKLENYLILFFKFDFFFYNLC